MKVQELRNGTPVWMPSKVGWLPLTVTAHDKSESLATKSTVPCVTVEVILEHQRREQYQKVDARALRPRDPVSRGSDKPEMEPSG